MREERNDYDAVLSVLLSWGGFPVTEKEQNDMLNPSVCATVLMNGTNEWCGIPRTEKKHIDTLNPVCTIALNLSNDGDGAQRYVKCFCLYHCVESH